ncbi:hypothetical protein CDAR_164851 [Caerostris darwini]|uniref:Uncharacterized protein n=1 Tax=Caerostris darwini TaxID=1538125 RepID=A0AAV4T6F8_9ARAC|nr:hypothetical protein CDAR_164851 [Caerostris darwini]
MLNLIPPISPALAIKEALLMNLFSFCVGIITEQSDRRRGNAIKDPKYFPDRSFLIQLWVNGGNAPTCMPHRPIAMPVADFCIVCIADEGTVTTEGIKLKKACQENGYVYVDNDILYS